MPSPGVHEDSMHVHKIQKLNKSFKRINYFAIIYLLGVPSDLGGLKTKFQVEGKEISPQIIHSFSLLTGYSF